MVSVNNVTNEEKINMIRLFQEIKKIEPRLLPFGILSAVLEGGYIILSLTLIRSALAMFSPGTEGNRIYYVSILGISSLIIKMLQIYCKKIFDGRCFPALLGFEKKVAQASMEAEYEQTLDQDFLALASSAQTSVCGSGIGVHLVMTSFLAVLTSLAGCISSGIVLGEGSVVAPLYCMALVLLSSVISLKGKEKEMSFQTELDDQGRKEMHWHLLLSDFSYGKDIRLYRAVRWVIGKFRVVQREGEELVHQINRKTIRYAIARVIVDVIRDGGLLVFLIWNVWQGRIDVSFFVTLLISIRSFSSHGMQLLEHVMNIQSQQTYIDSYFRYTENVDMDANIPTRQPVNGDICISHVTFGYPGAEKAILRDLNLKINKGEKIALVGLNGAGKSTLVNLLCRFFTPQKGTITVDNVDITDYSKQDYAKLISCVFQDSTLFAFSVEENITMNSSSEKTDRNQITKILEQVGLSKKISDQTDYGKVSISKRFNDQGIGLSGGELCKLAIARALYKEAPILIMDEPTAALDPPAEKQIYEMIETLGKNKTIIFISHRMASTQFCDKVVFLENGTIVEEGSHEELMRKKGKYADLFHVQAKYYNSGEEWTE